MEKRSRRKLGARRYADYSQETLNVAVDLVQSKALSSYEAEQQFGIPRRTILNRCKNMHDKAIGRPTELSAEEEKHIVEVVEVAADFGSPLTLVDLRIVVHNYLQKCGKTELFNGRMPGERWARNFLKRHNFTQRATQNIKRNRASKSVEEMTTFYENLESSLKDVPCENILNFDETNLSDDPGSTKAIFKRGTKHPERVLNSSKSSVSIMFSGTADGQCLPPYVVYKSDHLWLRWCKGGPPNARYNRTKSGWFDMVCFDDWFKEIILPWANSRQGPKVIIGDNLASHLSVEVVKLCQDNNIRLVFLPPNATHLTQPLDVAFFGPMKRCWRQILLNYKLTHQNSTTINKSDFPQLLHELMTKINMGKTSNLCSGFAGSGIFPLNASRVLAKIPVVPSEETKNFDLCLLEYLKKSRSITTPSNKGPNKKLAVPAGKSVSTEDAEKMQKGNGKTSKKCQRNVAASLPVPVLQQPKSLKQLTIIIVNKFLLHCGSGSLKKSKKNQKIKILSDVIIKPATSNTAVCEGKNLASGLQKAKKLGCDSGNLSNQAKNAQVLSSILVKAGSSFGKPNTRANSKDQNARCEKLNTKRKRVTMARDNSVLQSISIPKNEDNIIKSKKVKQRLYKSNVASRYSGSTTSVSDDMSEHSDSSVNDIDLLESDGENTEDLPEYCFKKAIPPPLNNHDDQISDDVLSEIDSHAPRASKRSRSASVHRTSKPSPPATSDSNSHVLHAHSASKRSRTASLHRASEPSQPANTDSNSQVFHAPSASKKDAVLSDEILSISNTEREDQTIDYFSVNDTVLVRYYTKKNNWKYYVGGITACNVDQTYDVSFYTKTRNKGEITFKKPKKVDRDTVPKISLVKIIKIDKISIMPEEYKLHDQEDAIYF